MIYPYFLGGVPVGFPPVILPFGFGLSPVRPGDDFLTVPLRFPLLFPFDALAAILLSSSYIVAVFIICFYLTFFNKKRRAVNAARPFNRYDYIRS